jgi:hypothetical protein
VRAIGPFDLGDAQFKVLVPAGVALCLGHLVLGVLFPVADGGFAGQ